MLGVSIFLAAVVAVHAVLGSPVQARTAYVVKETHYIPHRWSKIGRAQPETMLNLHIGVKQGNFDELERHLYEVSDPSHTRYGQHLTHEDVNELIRPADDSLDLVHEWLDANGIRDASYSPAMDWINLWINVDTAERLLDTQYYLFQHEDGTQLVRAPKWSLPQHLHKHIDAVQPTSSFMRPRSAQDSTPVPFPYPGLHNPTSPALKAVCTVNGTTPDCFQTLYGTKGYVQEATAKNQIGFNNFLGSIPIRTDAAKFLSIYRPDAVGEAFEWKDVDINGGPPSQAVVAPGQDPEGIAGEANLDVQTIIGMTYPMKVTAFSTGGTPPQVGDAGAGSIPGNEPYLDWLNSVLASTDLPQVISTSYGDDEQTVPFEYAQRVCQGFAQLGARGISLLFSSGDGGVGNAAFNNASECVSNDGLNTFKFIPSFPSTCPYITSVGGTQGFEPETSVSRPANGLGPDGAIHGFFAGGSGFSDYFPRPKYQEGVVPQYVEALNGTYKGLFNPLGRAYPDIAAQGLYFERVLNGTVDIISGTSASCPLAASIIALVNDALISCGKSPLGFLNPWLYKEGYKSFTDITSGTQGGCGTQGFPVTAGWDAVTGFGTPNFPEMVKAAKDAKTSKDGRYY